MYKAESDVIDRRYELSSAKRGNSPHREKGREINEIFTRFYALDELQDTAALRTLSEALRLTLDQRSQDLAQVKFKDSNISRPSNTTKACAVSSKRSDLKGPGGILPTPSMVWKN